MAIKFEIIPSIVGNNAGVSVTKNNASKDSPVKSNGDGKSNPLSRLSHLNVSISGGDKGSPSPPTISHQPPTTLMQSSTIMQPPIRMQPPNIIQPPKPSKSFVGCLVYCQGVRRFLN